MSILSISQPVCLEELVRKWKSKSFNIFIKLQDTDNELVWLQILVKTHKTKAWLDNLWEMINTDLQSHKGGDRKKTLFNQMKNFLCLY